MAIASICRHRTWEPRCPSCESAARAAAAEDDPLARVFRCVMGNDSGADQLAGIYEVLSRHGYHVPFRSARWRRHGPTA